MGRGFEAPVFKILFFLHLLKQCSFWATAVYKLFIVPPTKYYIEGDELSTFLELPWFHQLISSQMLTWLFSSPSPSTARGSSGPDKGPNKQGQKQTKGGYAFPFLYTIRVILLIYSYSITLIFLLSSYRAGQWINITNFLSFQYPSILKI